MPRSSWLEQINKKKFGDCGSRIIWLSDSFRYVLTIQIMEPAKGVVIHLVLRALAENVVSNHFLKILLVSKCGTPLILQTKIHLLILGTTIHIL